MRQQILRQSRALEVGSRTDNMHDMIGRGRAHHPAKIDADAVRAIRDARLAGVDVDTLAERYGITRWHVYKIAQGIRRRDVA